MGEGARCDMFKIIFVTCAFVSGAIISAALADLWGTWGILAGVPIGVFVGPTAYMVVRDMS